MGWIVVWYRLSIYFGGFKSEVQYIGINERGLIAVCYSVAILEDLKGHRTSSLFLGRALLWLFYPTPRIGCVPHV